MVFEYAPAPESTKIVNLKSNYELFIGGKFVKSKAGSNYKTINPATEAVSYTHLTLPTIYSV